MSDSDRLDRALEDLLAGRSPRALAGDLDPSEQQMLRVAQLLRGSRAEEPAPEFVESLHDQLFSERQRISRRTAFVGALGSLAAGVIGGLGLERALQPGRKKLPWAPLVGSNGAWVAVASQADLPHGSVKAFQTGHIQGFLINNDGQIRALSRICTHMGCQLEFERRERNFICPCHGAEFTLSGDLRYGPRGYPIPLPPLPEIKVRQRNGRIEVWSV
jgi:nitrite reductase/ring-hydroxylating ferredoxin subunit